MSVNIISKGKDLFTYYYIYGDKWIRDISAARHFVVSTAQSGKKRIQYLNGTM